MRKNFIYAALSAFMLMGAQPIMAQSGMTDSQVIQYVQEGTKQGKSQQQLMVELSAKGDHLILIPQTNAYSVVPVDIDVSSLERTNTADL